MKKNNINKMGAADISILGLEIWIHKREFPNSTEYWDANWLLSTARCCADNAWVITEGPFIHLSEIKNWLKDLEKLNQTLEGKANLACLEEYVYVEIKIEDDEQISLEVHITPNHMTQNHLFRFEIDKSYLPVLISQCKIILQNYPIKADRD